MELPRHGIRGSNLSSNFEQKSCILEVTVFSELEINELTATSCTRDHNYVIWIQLIAFSCRTVCISRRTIIGLIMSFTWCLACTPLKNRCSARGPAHIQYKLKPTTFSLEEIGDVFKHKVNTWRSTACSLATVSNQCTYGLHLWRKTTVKNSRIVIKTCNS